jgi:hypothetical protein
MDFEEEFELGDLIFAERQCRKCLRTLSLVEDFYKTRPDRGKSPSAYSYECKQCTIRRVAKSRRQIRKWITEYPDW